MSLKTLLKYILISLIQGFTEPLPISSSAHMIIVSKVLKIKSNDLTLEIFLNFASMLAIFLFMFTKRMNLKLTIKNYSLIIKIIIASIPTIIIGLIFKNYIAKISVNLFFIGITLIVTSIMLYISFKLYDKCNITSINNITSLKLGFAQSIALVPGISRMGTILTGGILSKINIRTILDFSFLMYLVVSVGSFVLSVPSFITIDKGLLVYYLISFVVTFITTYFSIRFFYNIISKKSLLTFSIYTILLGFILLLLG